MDDDRIVERLRHLGAQPLDPQRTAADLNAIAALGGGPRRTGLFGSKVRVAAAFAAGLLLGSTGLAAADALPDPAQHVAHTVLGRVGVDVPNPDRYHGPECGAEVKRNHGAYVRDDHALAQTDCGKPVGAGGEGADDKGDKGAAKGPCHGKPPWAGNKAMTPDEVAAAKAQRAAECGADVDESDADGRTGDTQDEVDAPSDATEPEPPDGSGEPTTTTEAPTTTLAPTTTEATTTTAG